MKSLAINQMENCLGGKMKDAVGCAFGVAGMMFGFIGLGALTGGLSIAGIGAVVSYSGGLYSVITSCQSEETVGGGGR